MIPSSSSFDMRSTILMAFLRLMGMIEPEGAQRKTSDLSRRYCSFSATFTGLPFALACQSSPVIVSRM
jgi:hypothetical protein